MINLTEARNYIKDHLGDCVVEVELAEQHYDASIKSAIQLMNLKLPGTRMTSLPVSGAQKKYPIDITQYPGFIGILSVEFVRPTETDMADISENPFALHNAIIEVGDASSYELSKMYRKDYKRVYSSDPEWETQWEYDPATRRNKYILYIDLPTYAENDFYVCSFEYAYRYTPDDDPRTGLPTITPDIEQWVLDYSLARAKIILGGRIRDKFKGIPSPDGTDLQLDGESMLQEGQDERKELEEEIDLMQRPLPPVVD